MQPDESAADGVEVVKEENKRQEYEKKTQEM